MTDTLKAEHESLQRAVQASRKAFQQGPEGAFASGMRKAMDEYHGMREGGVSREDAIKGLEAVLRDVWPNQPTKFPPSCDACDASGWREVICWDQQRCGRVRCVKAGSGFEHLYVVACECGSGDRRRARAAVSEEDEIIHAARRKPKPRGFSRVGR